MGLTRRDFFKQTGCALSATALLAGLEQLGMISALAQTPASVSDYRALVCIFMSGGSDGNNVVIPYDHYSDAGGYAAVRSASGLAVPQSALLQITPFNLGVKYGLHPNLSPEVANPGSAQGLMPIWQAGKLAVLCNVGTLIQPLTKTQYQNSPSLRPYQLFSHSDQVTQQQTSVSSTPAQTGWGGRISDVLANVNGAAPLPMIISTGGTALFTSGQTTRPLSISATGALNGLFDLSLTGTTSETSARRASFDQIRALDNNLALVKATNDSMAQAILTDTALGTDPVLTTVFPTTSLGNQLKQIAKLIKANLTQGSLALKRQIFFCTIGGFDTHTNQTSANPTSPNGAGGQGNLLTQLSQAMKAFYDATIELEQIQPGASSQITTFTLSDFGRTLQPSGSGAAAVGSDHGWGSHQFIMGGAVAGGRFYGTFPTLALGGPDDTDSGSNPRGRWIPTTSIDQYAATLARWYGVADADIPTILPFIGRFPTSNLGFLG